MSLEKLAAARHPAPEWATFTELRNQTGYSRHERRFDVAAFNCWPSKNHWRVVYEVKRTRSDFLRELEQPEKRADAERYFHETWFVCSYGVCKEGEVPDGWGLLVATKDGSALRKARAARAREPLDPPMSLILSVLRRAQAQVAELERRQVVRFGDEELTEEKLTKLIEERVATRVESLKTSQQAALKAQHEAQAARRLLRAPLERLRERAGTDSPLLLHSRSDEQLYVTPAEVDELIEKAAGRRIRSYAADLQAARKACDDLLENMKEYPL